ncbi:MAG: hypothetical protein KJO65_03245 [Gemmatimonadetes bacterium]|nr:hypothetical protein [Gemmatimonadota bacterium]
MAKKNGFVLVEVLMDGVAAGALVALVALMGIQSATAFPRWSESREASQRTALRWELENVVAQQALHQADQGRFAASLDELEFEPSSGVLVELVAATWGWSASASHEGLSPGEGCSVRVVTSRPAENPVRPGRGEIACTE